MLIPASAVGGRDLGSVYEVKSFLAERLLEVMQVRDAVYWRARLERMLQRPANEGPVLLVVLDGMSQQPQASWQGLLKVLQGTEFVGRVRYWRGAMFDEHNINLYVNFRPLADLQLGTYMKFGQQLDLRAARTGRRTMVGTWGNVNLGRGFNAEWGVNRQRLRRHGGAGTVDRLDTAGQQ